MLCRCDPHSESTSSQSRTLTVALAGNPNSGKTTIFNALTGLRQKVANYPGVTVEKKTGRCKLGGGRWVNVIDLPGTYSLISRSPDELIAMEVLRGLRSDTPPPDIVIVVVDASNLQRNLYLVSQLIELGRPLVIALNMMDIAERRGTRISPEALEKELGVPVVAVVGHRRKGIDELKKAIDRAAVAPMPDWPLPPAMKEELIIVGGGLAILDTTPSTATPLSPSTGTPGEGRGEGSLLPAPNAKSPSIPDGVTSPPRSWICRGDDDIRHLDRYQALAERLLIGDVANDLGPIIKHEPVASLLSAATSRMAALGLDPMQADIEAHYIWIENIVSKCTTAAPLPSTTTLDYAPKPTLTARVDAILLHRIWGLLIFSLIMATLFVSIFWLAKPIMEGIQAGISWFGASVTANMDEGPLKALLTDGIFAGVGAVVVFVPQIALLFLFLAILEDSGYLARAAFLMDRLLAKVGLHGKSFIPLLSSFACAIPGIMATRTIENRKDRLATILIAPFMSCSARLPVYTLLIGTFFAAYGAWTQAGIMLSLYLLGIVAAVFTAWIFKRTFLKGPAQTFILELPTYKVPQASQITRQVWFNTSKFLTKAGTTIFCLSVILWAMTYYPRLPESRREVVIKEAAAKSDAEAAQYQERTRKWIEANIAAGNQIGIPAPPNWPEVTIPQPKWKYPFVENQPRVVNRDQVIDQAIASEQLRQSLAGRIGHVIEPAIKPLGYDWKMGIGLVGAFAAREVFVSTMAITYGAGDADNTQSLSSALINDRYQDGRPVWTPLVATSLLVWFVLAMQCMSTLAIVRRETGGWKWPLFMLTYMNGLAYVVSLLIFQIGSRLL
jgi:ferrous iron transport protein B